MRKVSNEPFRKCACCEKVKPKEDFQIPSDLKTGRGRNTCNECRILQIKKWANKNRNNINEHQRSYNRTLNGRTNLLYNSARLRAKAKNQNFLITKEHVYKALENGFCQQTLFPFDLESHGSTWQSPFAPSIDKIDPFGIYEPDNVQYVCWWYNISKQQWSDEIVHQMCRRIAERYPK